ncbi:conserved hypothetical protein [Rippkaea orientalis PCC 8801]|uniref:HetZ-related protein 2 n=1 Tax=Rippkaea orientalis (strain PCC 8801 / RF-1) TaxID=41431 RepID=B7JZ42_RIPO1|nr:HetZ-related protein 2 [Rippkaea orientalis]ACK67253.1 conserved hypothetical protein [Rippkaea orientalis PCC 8801]
MIQVVSELENNWQTYLLEQAPDQTPEVRQIIIRWLFGEDQTRWETMTAEGLAIAKQGMDYRYSILQKRYLDKPPTVAYRNLINRLGSLVVLRNKIQTWVSLSRDRQRAVTDVLQEVIQELLNSDRYIQGQIAWISQCTTDQRLRNSLLLTTIEEYSLRPIRNQPLLVYRFVNYLRRSSRGGMTQVPQKQLIRLISEEIGLDESETTISLLDNQAVEAYQASQQWEEQQLIRHKVQEEFTVYLAQKIGQEAVEWLKLYLEGRSQEAIAQQLNLPIKQVYRLREKVSYHAIQGFSLKQNPELVAHWLQISAQEHNLGLTPNQWEAFWQDLTVDQQVIIQHLKNNQSLDEIALVLNWKKKQVLYEWRTVYLKAQSLRTG